jgi:hypothetical protein
LTDHPYQHRQTMIAIRGQAWGQAELAHRVMGGTCTKID